MANQKPPNNTELSKLIRDADLRLQNLKAEQARRQAMQKPSGSGK